MCEIIIWDGDDSDMFCFGSSDLQRYRLRPATGADDGKILPEIIQILFIDASRLFIACRQKVRSSYWIMDFASRFHHVVIWNVKFHYFITQCKVAKIESFNSGL
jgi:hypothetical protein